MTRPITAREIGEQSAHKPLGRFGSKSVERVSIEPVRTSPVRLRDDFPAGLSANLSAASAVSPETAHNLHGPFEAGSVDREITR